MLERPVLSKELDSATFREYYYLKEELVQFCRENQLPTSGGKMELTERIICFLDTGEVVPKASVRQSAKKPVNQSVKGAAKQSALAMDKIEPDTIIEDNFVCSQRHRAFFGEHIGKSFSFNVRFQKWLKENSGKTYQEAIEAYARILEEKKKTKTTIDKQFEYNTYIRDFFADNQGKTLEDAICCWKYKKSQKGHHRYEKSDLIALCQ